MRWRRSGGREKSQINNGVDERNTGMLKKEIMKIDSRIKQIYEVEERYKY